MNKPFKKKRFVKWYSNCVTEELKSGKSVNDINIAPQMSVVKPLSAS